MSATSFFSGLFSKFSFSDDQPVNQEKLNTLALDRSDGAIELDNYTNSYMMNTSFTYNSQAELIEMYREVANYSMVDYAVEDIINETISFLDDESPITLDLTDIDKDLLSDNLKEKVYESWEVIDNMLELSETIHRRARSFYVDGRVAYQKVVDVNNISKGLQDVIELDVKYVSKFRNIQYSEQNKTITGYKEYFIYDENIPNAKTKKETDKKLKKDRTFELDKDLIVYVTSGLTDSKTGYAVSWLHKAVKPANQLRMMENSLVIYRITRAPERRVFYVDTSGMQTSKAREFLTNLKNSYRNRMSFDPTTGTFKDQKHMMTMQEDFWLPRNSNGKGTEVDTLAGGCLSMDTKVSLLDGRELSIADIKYEMDQGKILWTYSTNPENGEVVPGVISWAGVTHESAKVMRLTLDNGEQITCTPDHKFPVYGKGFLRADELSINESMIPLYRKKENISEFKKLDYEQYFDNKSKKWIYTHRMVADYLRDDVVEEYIYESNDEGFSVRHHKDFNRHNNDPQNLCFMGWKDHQKLHSDYGFSREAGLLGTEAARNKKLNIKSVHNHRIVNIEYLDDPIQVGTLTIDLEEKYHNYHTFALSCGIFTKNSNLDEIADVIYFQKELYKALNVPMSRLDPESNISFGRQSEISRDELKLSKLCSKIRKRMNMIWLDLLETQLILTKVITVAEWKNIKSKIKFKYSQDLYIEEMKKMELLNGRIATAKEMNEFVGKYFSHDFMRKEVLHQTEQEIEEQDKLMLKEKSDPKYKVEDTDQGFRG